MTVSVMRIMDVRTVLQLLGANPHIASVPFTTVLTFCDLTRWLHAEIAFSQPSYVETPLNILPHDIHHFLVAALTLDDQVCRLLWTLLQRYIWTTISDVSDLEDRNGALVNLFLQHGVPYCISTSIPFISFGGIVNRTGN